MGDNSNNVTIKDASTVEKVASLEDSDKDLQEPLTQTQINTEDAKTHTVSETGIQNDEENIEELIKDDQKTVPEPLTQSEIETEDAKDEETVIANKVSEAEIQKNEENLSKNDIEKVVDETIENKDDQRSVVEEPAIIQNEKQTPEEDQIEESKLVLINQESNDTKIEIQEEVIEITQKESEESFSVPPEEPEKQDDSAIQSEIPVAEPEPEIISNIEDEPLEVIEEKRLPQPITHDGQEMDLTILNLLENRLKQIGIIKYNMKMSPGCKPGDNMLGIIAKVQINGTDSNTDSNTELHWIVKIAPPIQALRKMVKLDILYRNEVLIYESVFPIYKELEKERSIMNGFNSYPDYLFSNLLYLKETVVMTDMTSLGYISRDKKEPLELEHVKLVMKTYGKLHALSYAFQDNRPSVFEEFSSSFQRNIQNAIDVFELQKTQQGIMEGALATLDPIRHNLTYKKFSKFVENFMAIYFEASRNSNKYSVIGHGDSWITNMLFKYQNSSPSSLPTAVCLLDFQTVNYASPVCDISYFLFTCTDKDFRDQHYDNVVKLYYYSLCSHLTDLGCDPEKYLPFHILEAELKKFSVAGLYLSILALTAMIRNGDEVGDCSENTNQDIYNERIRDVILDFSQKGYLDFLFPKK